MEDPVWDVVVDSNMVEEELMKNQCHHHHVVDSNMVEEELMKNQCHHQIEEALKIQVRDAKVKNVCHYQRHLEEVMEGLVQEKMEGLVQEAMVDITKDLAF